MSKQTFLSYTEEQSNYLKQNWALMPTEEREELSKKWNRTRQSLSNRFSYMQGSKKNKKSVVKSETLAKQVKVTHINKDIAPVNIYIDATRVEIPTRSLSINGIQLSW